MNARTASGGYLYFGRLTGEVQKHPPLHREHTVDAIYK